MAKLKFRQKKLNHLNSPGIIGKNNVLLEQINRVDQRYDHVDFAARLFLRDVAVHVGIIGASRIFKVNLEKLVFLVLKLTITNFLIE